MLQPSINDRLVTLAVWLEALGIPYTRPSKELILKIKQGTTDIYLSIGLGAMDGIGQGEGMEFDPDILSARNRRNQGWPIFQTYLKDLGFDVWDIFPRKESQKAKLSNSFEDTNFRHHVFRNCINPSNEAMKQYESAVLPVVRRFYSYNREFCFKMGYHTEDLKQFALVWAVNFHNTVRLIPVEGESLANDNLKLLLGYVKQRISDLAFNFKKKGRNIFTAGVEDLFPPEGSAEWEPDTFPQEEQEEVKRSKSVYDPTKAEPRDLFLARRRSKNSKKFKEMLAMLPHDYLISALVTAKMNEEGLTQRLAINLLQKHTKNCEQCLEGEKNTTAIDPGSTQKLLVNLL